LWHRVVHIWIINSKAELLLQLRSKTKPDQPGKWDISIGGHIAAGETSCDACMREAKEELGLNLPAEAFGYLFTLKRESSNRPGRLNREFCDVYLVHLDLPESAYRFDDGEVEAVRYMPWRKLRETLALDGGGYVPHPDEYAQLFKVLEDMN
ncbi:MAG: NUDIX domain-containing protein, partial [Rickettsiales bacterium]|nr:NUDIX domain-containing protein [Rickettsiales bacterium]